MTLRLMCEAFYLRNSNM